VGWTLSPSANESGHNLRKNSFASLALVGIVSACHKWSMIDQP
jgi:hypothetical protein